MEQDMASVSERGGALLARFAEFYEEVARLKLAIHEGQVPMYLAGGSAANSAASVSAGDLAALVSQRLKMRLQDQAKHVALIGTQAEIDSYRIAQYAMAALADELLIIETDWSGRDAWQQYLLEQSVVGSSCAGCGFFEYLDELLNSRTVGPLEEELAAVFLMSLRLGFQGEYRGTHGESHLKHYNTRLIRFMGNGGGAHRASFQQAYEHRIAGASDERMAPLSRWYRFGAIALAVYLLISTVVWITLTDRLTNVFRGG
jgi:type VI secretion system protein ImpK